MSTVTNNGGSTPWRTARRIAWFDAVRNRLRSLFTALLIAIPVAGGVLVSSLLVPITGVGQPSVPESIGNALVYLGDDMALDERLLAAGARRIDKAEWADASAELPDKNELTLQVLAADDLGELASGWSALNLVEGRLPEDANEVAVHATDFERELLGERMSIAGAEYSVVGRALIPDISDGYNGTVAMTSSGLNRSDAIERSDSEPVSAIFAPSQMGELRNMLRPTPYRVIEPQPSVGHVAVGPFEFYTTAAATSDALGLFFYFGYLPAIAIIVILIVFMVMPSFAVSAQSHRRMLDRLIQNGASAKAAWRVLAVQAVVLTAIGAVVGVAVALAVAAVLFRQLATFVPAFTVGAVPVLVDVMALVVGTTAVSTLLSTRLVARRPAQTHEAAAPGRPVMSVLRLVVGVALLTVSMVLWAGFAYGEQTGNYLLYEYAMFGDRLFPVVLAIAAGAVLAPGILALQSRAFARSGFSTRFAAREVVRHVRRTAPAFTAIAAVSGIYVGAVITTESATTSGSATVLQVEAWQDTPEAAAGARSDFAARVNAADIGIAAAEATTVRASAQLLTWGGFAGPSDARTQVLVDDYYVDDIRCGDAATPRPCGTAGSVYGHLASMTEADIRALWGHTGLVVDRDVARPVSSGRASDTFLIGQQPLPTDEVPFPVSTIVTELPASAGSTDNLSSVKVAAVLPRQALTEAGTELRGEWSDEVVMLRAGGEPFSRAQLSELERIARDTGVEFAYGPLDAGIAWGLALIFAGVAALFTAVVVWLNSRSLAGQVCTLRALGGTGRVARRVSAISAALMTLPAMAIGAGLGVVASSADTGGLGVASQLYWPALVVGLVAVPTVAVVVGVVSAPRTPVTTRRV